MPGVLVLLGDSARGTVHVAIDRSPPTYDVRHGFHGSGHLSASIPRHITSQSYISIQLG